MKAKTLCLLAGITTPLILTGSVQAGFLGISTVSKSNEFGLLVCNVYAVFNQSGDFLFSPFGDSFNPLNIFVKNGKFFQDMQGMAGVGPPPESFGDGKSGLLLWDTFVTGVGIKATQSRPSTTPSRTIRRYSRKP